MSDFDKLDYLAMAALRCVPTVGDLVTPADVATLAYQVADAMLAERARRDALRRPPSGRLPAAGPEVAK